MKKILHLFSDPSHSALWSRYLRMLTLIALLAFGSHGVWGETKSVSLENMTNPKKGGSCDWSADNRTLSWKAASDNYVEIPNLTGDFTSYYDGNIIFSYSELSAGAKFRVIITKIVNNQETNYQYYLPITDATSKDVVLPIKEFTSQKDSKIKITAADLTNVSRIAVAGYETTTGSVSFGKTFTITTESPYKSIITEANVDGRNYQIYVPAGITETSGLKLLFALHGRGDDYKFLKDAENLNTGIPHFRDQADKDKNVVIVSPEGTGKLWNAYTDKSNPEEIAKYNTDFEFLKSIILALTKKGTDNPTYNGIGQVTIDRTKVFTVGFSNGGMMSYALVTNHPDVFAAGGSVSGLPVNQYALHKSNGHPVPFIHFQGKGDNFVRYEQSAQHIKNWVAYNGCGSLDKSEGTYDVNNTSDYHVEYNKGKVPFHFYGVNGAGHIANMTYDGTSSSQLIWDFIKDRTLGGNAVDMTVVWCPELSELNKYSSRAWGGLADNYVVTSDENAAGNQGVNDRICFEKGKHQLRFTANGTVKIKIYKIGAASALFYKQNKVVNSETVFEFDVAEAGDYIVEINRSSTVTFSAFGIYKLDLPIESTILDSSNTPTFSNGVAQYSGVGNGTSATKYLNVDMSNYDKIKLKCSEVSGVFYLHYPTNETSLQSMKEHVISLTTSGEFTIASHGGTTINVDYFRLNYKNTYDSGQDVVSTDATSMYDFTQINYESKGSNLTITDKKVDYNNSYYTFTKNAQRDNLVDLNNGRDGAVGTGIRFHYKGGRIRVIVNILNDNQNYTQYIEKNSSEFWATRHLSWKDDFGFTDEQIANINRIRIGGDDTNSETETFDIMYIWFDDVDDYNRTFVCYGYEEGREIEKDLKYQYKLGTATATFSPFGWNNFQGGTMYLKIPASGTVTISNDEPYTKYTDIKLFFDKSCDYNLTCGSDNKKGYGGVLQFNTNSKDITITNNGTNDVYLSKIEFNTSYEVLDDYTLNGRKYWLYVPSSAANKKDVPVIFSLHGKQTNSANPTGGTDAPNFHSIANSKGVIIVLPEGRKIYDNNTCYGWQADGEENDDTKFIQALVKEIQTKYASQSSSNGYISVDPKRFYLCGFSEGGMMTYACAKVLNGTFAAYGSCGGFPLTDYHLNLATKQPVPFIHLHGDKDDKFGINHLHTIIENLLFRNGCKLDSYSSNVTDQFKKYDFTGVNGVPVTTVTFIGHGHAVHASAPQYLWDFFSPKKLDTYDPTTMKWQWDMTTINNKLDENNGNPYGWKRVAVSENTHGTLTYGDNRKTTCNISECTSAANGCDGNHNVYNSIQLEKGTYKLHAKAHLVKSDATGIIVDIYKVGATENSGTCIIRRKVANNSGNEYADLSILYPFTITEDGEYYVKVERGNDKTTCTELAIHTSDYAPNDEDDSEGVRTFTDEEWKKKKKESLILNLDFEDTEIKIKDKIKEESKSSFENNKFKETAPSSGYDLYFRHEKGTTGVQATIDDVIQNDAVFGNYYQNNPKAEIYDRSGEMNYLRAVLPVGGLKDIKTNGEATIGFWVNGKVAVDAALSYYDASMFYISGPDRNQYYPKKDPKDDSKIHTEYQSMFNIRCNGNTNGFYRYKHSATDSTQIRYYANGMFGDYCDNSGEAGYYKKNLYLDRNWHYVTMVMYNNLRNVDMYIDGELTNSRQNIVGSDQVLTAGVDTLNHILIGGLNATYTNFGYDPAFAYDDIVLYSRALSSEEINAIIKDKNYSPNSWEFDKNIKNTAMLSTGKLDENYWTKAGDIYTLNKTLSTSAQLTYDGIKVIPAFRGLYFKTTKDKQIQIDVANGLLIVEGEKNEASDATDVTEMTVSNALAGQFIRYEYSNSGSGWLSHWSGQDFEGDIFPNAGNKTGVAKVNGESGTQMCKVRIQGKVGFKSIGSTDKMYAELTFGTSTGEANLDKVTKVDFSSDDLKNSDIPTYSNYPKLLLTLNGQGMFSKYNFADLTSSDFSGKIKFWSSAPHVAYITSTTNNQPTVKATGVPGSAYIYAELTNDNKYDCNTNDADLFQSKSRILARYEIHVPNKEDGHSVKISSDNDGKSYNVGDALETTDKAVTLTLGGWSHTKDGYKDTNDNTITDGYSNKAQWKGMPLKKKTNDTNGYQSVYDTEGAYTDNQTYFKLDSYTGGTYAAKSETLSGTAGTGLFSEKTHSNNSSAWTLPCRGSYAKVQPTEAGIISVYVLQEGCMERNMDDEANTYDGVSINANEPYDITIKKVYVADEAGKIIEDVITDTKSKIVSQVWKDDGRARAEYSYYVINTAYSNRLHDQFMKNIIKASGANYATALLDNWPNPGMTQKVIKFGKGYGVVDKGIVRYTFNVLPGKTYYIFSNDAKMGIAGFNFTKDKQLNFSDNKIVENKPLVAEDLTQDTKSFYDVFYSPDSEKKSLDTSKENKNVKLTYNRSFTAGVWSSICLPYSISNRQMKEQFGEGTQVVLLNKIYNKDGHGIVQFIWHANQDIIAGYPYLILPDKTTSQIVTNSAILQTSPLFSVSEKSETYDNGQTLPNEYVFKGNFKEEEIPVGSYVLNTSGKLSRVAVPGLKLKPFRAYLRNNAGSNAKLLTSMAFSGWDDLDDLDNTTSIDEILEENGIFTKGANVYDLNGVLVRKNTHTIQGLPKGIYIVNGKKYVVK